MEYEGSSLLPITIGLYLTIVLGPIVISFFY